MSKKLRFLTSVQITRMKSNAEAMWNKSRYISIIIQIQNSERSGKGKIMSQCRIRFCSGDFWVASTSRSHTSKSPIEISLIIIFSLSK